MKRHYWTILLLFFSAAYAQEPNKAKSFNEFGPVGCEIVLVNAENLYAQIAEAPNTKAVVVIDGNRLAFEKYRRQILARFQFRRAENRIAFLIGEPKAPQAKVAFWLVPDGAPMPEGNLWTEPRTDLSRPFVFGYANEIGICPTFVPRLFAKLLNENQSAKAHMVVFGETSAARRQFAQDWLDEFKKDYGLQKDRFRVFFVKRRGITNADFWFVPKSK